jgi:hypothetical protein
MLKVLFPNSPTCSPFWLWLFLKNGAMASTLSVLLPLSVPPQPIASNFGKRSRKLVVFDQDFLALGTDPPSCRLLHGEVLAWPPTIISSWTHPLKSLSYLTPLPIPAATTHLLLGIALCFKIPPYSTLSRGNLAVCLQVLAPRISSKHPIVRPNLCWLCIPGDFAHSRC